jgi:ankyrin repeat protein
MSARPFNNNGKQKLINAVCNRNIERVRWLVSSGGENVDIASADGWTSCTRCCYYGYSEILEYLIRHGADTALASSNGWHPLHHAAGFNRQQCVVLLLRHGVDVNAGNPFGRTAIWLASFRGYLSIVKLLVEGGAEFEGCGRAGVLGQDKRSPIDAAREKGYFAVVRYLGVESKWRRMRALAMVCSSVRDEEPISPMLRVFLCDDLAREISSYL